MKPFSFSHAASHYRNTCVQNNNNNNKKKNRVILHQLRFELNTLCSSVKNTTERVTRGDKLITLGDGESVLTVPGKQPGGRSRVGRAQAWRLEGPRPSVINFGLTENRRSHHNIFREHPGHVKLITDFNAPQPRLYNSLSGFFKKNLLCLLCPKFNIFWNCMFWRKLIKNAPTQWWIVGLRVGRSAVWVPWSAYLFVQFRT
ncbi:hypothetical protein EGW08_022763, partial [Elysia chlorotica]